MKKKIRNSVEDVYNELRQSISQEDEWLFEKSVRIRKSQAIPQILGWMERVLVSVNETECENNVIALRVAQILQRMSVTCLYQ